MRYYKLIVNIIIICLSPFVYGQTSIRVIEKGTGEPVPFSLLYCSNNYFLGETNDEGLFLLTNQPCDTIYIKNLSYRDTSINLSKLDKTNIIYVTKTNLLETIEIFANRPLNLRQESYSLAKLKSLPIIFGERDIIKSLALTPGVQQTIEGTSSISVRGGGSDQNLLVMDGAKIYNSGHMFGFLSIVNDKIIKDLKFYKSYIPANYSSRLSSVIDLEVIDGNKREHNKSLTLGLINSNFNINGPLIKDKLSYVLGARMAYTGLILAPVQVSKSKDKINYNVIDLNTKLSYQLNENQKINFSLNYNKDLFKNKTIEIDQILNVNLNWGNTTGGFEYFNLIKNKYILRTSLNYSNYKNTLNISSERENNNLNLKNLSEIKDYSSHAEFSGKISNNLDFKTGIFSSIAQVSPIDRYLNAGDQMSSIKGYSPKIINHAIYGDLFYSLKFIDLRMGLRLDHFENLSESQFNNFLQPRPQVIFHISKELSVETAYTKSFQNMHSISTTAGSFFIDVWVPSTTSAIPSGAEMINLGIFYKKKKWSMALELYQKNFKNLTELDPKKNLFLSTNTDWQQDLLSGGIGFARGLEMYSDFKIRRQKFSVNYNFSKSSRKFDEINEGAWYDFRFDRRHVLNIAHSGEINQNWKINTVFTINSGNPLTLPTGLIQNINGDYDIFYDKFYNSRFPLYHRFDVAASYYTTTKKGNEVIWNFSLYNAYANRNIFGVQIYNKGKWEMKNEVIISEKSYFRFIPGISYTLNF